MSLVLGQLFDSAGDDQPLPNQLKALLLAIELKMKVDQQVKQD